MKVGIAQIKIEAGQPEINLKKCLDYVEKAKSKNLDLIIFPEFCLSGYLIGDLWEEESFLRDLEEMGQELAKATEGSLLHCIFGNVAVDWENYGEDGRVRKYNGVFVARDGELVRNTLINKFYWPKILMPNYRAFEESRHFYDLRKLAQESSHYIEDLILPLALNIGDSVKKVGLQLCEDGWSSDYSVDSTTLLIEKGCDLLINLSSSPFTLGKSNKRHRVFAKATKSTHCSLIYVNNVGIQNNAKTLYSFDGDSTIYQNGKVVYEMPKWEDLLGVFDLSNKSFEAPKFTPKQIEINSDFDLNYTNDIYKCLKSSVGQYMNQCGLKKVVIGVSGGVDSAVSAALFASLLGPENVLLVNMPSQYNSVTTKDLACRLASNLKCWYTTIPIDESVKLTKLQMQGLNVFDGSGVCSLTLKLSDFDLENVQARDRSSRILASLSSAFGGVFTCNANKSETMVGYSTLYGDHGGFIAPLADLWKEQVYALGMFLNKVIFESDMIPNEVFTIKPSAELNDSQNLDNGGGDPLVYWYHDRLFHSWMQQWNRISPEEILEWYADGVLEEKLNLSNNLSDVFSTNQAFITDLERWWKQFKGIGCIKRVQSPTICAVSRRSFGFDYRESIMQPYFTRNYLSLKKKLLS